jgi:hypothetical protein
MAGKSNPLYDLSPPPIQIPEATPVESMRSGGAGANAQFPPPGGTKAGAVANIASSFLHGMLAGKDIKERKMQETAQFSISSAWQTYQQLQATASDPSATEEARKMATANLGKAYQVWINNVEQYTQPGGKSQKKGVKGVLSRVGGALTAQKPTMGTEDMLALYKSPQMVQMMSQPHGPTLEQQTAQLKLAEEKRNQEQLQKADEINKQLTEALGHTDTPEGRIKASQLLQQQQALTGQLKDVQDPKTKELQAQAEQNELQLKSQMSKDAMPAYEKMQRGLPLTDAEKTVLGAYGIKEDKPDPLQIYMSMKGQRTTNKLTGRPVDVKNDRDAMDLYMADQAYWNKVGEKPTAYEEQNADLKRNIRMVFKAENGREPTEEEAAQRWMQVQYPPKTSAADKPRQIPTEEKGAIQVAVYRDLQANPKWKEFVKTENVGSTVSPRQVTRLVPHSGLSKEKQAQYDDMMKEVHNQLAARGFSEQDITEVTGGREYQMEGTPPSVANVKPGQAKKKYRVSYGGKTTEEEMTQSEIDGLKKDFPHFKVEEVTTK